MSPKRRIFLNVVATYGRSLYALAIGLFSARWALQALGEVDYGLYGLVGGLVGLVSFINTILSVALSRFYAVSVGTAKKCNNYESGLEECRKWFNTAIVIHMFLPLVLLLICYPAGEWAIYKFLTIPSDRVEACIWVWRLSLISSFISMFNVPFSAMYTAKQEIAELTLFSLFSTTCTAIFLYYMISHPGVWLVRYSVGMCIIYAIPQLAIALRAMVVYQECHIECRYMLDIPRIVQLAKFAFARFWSDFSVMIANQGKAILVNKYMGPAYNASMGIGNAVASHVSTLATSFSGALSPVISNLYGEGRIDEMKEYSHMTCRLGAVLMLIFSIPVALEINNLLKIWLVNPPAFVGPICIAVLIRNVMERMTDGYWMAIYSVGYQVMRYSWSVGMAAVSVVAISFVCFAMGLGMWSVVIGLIASKVLMVLVRLYYGKKLIGFATSHWLKCVFWPIMASSAISFLPGGILCSMLEPTFSRLVLTTLITEVVFLPLVWWFVFEKRERDWAVERIKVLLHRK